MNVSELFDLTHWVSTQVEEARIVAKYQALHKILQQHAQPNQQRQPFESQKDDLVSSLRKAPLSKLTQDQLEFLRNLGIAEALGQEGIDTVEDVLYRNVIDVATSANKIQEISQKVARGVEKSNQIKSGLDGCVTEESYEADNEVLMRVSFAGGASLGNVTDFKNWGSVWFDIGRGIAMAHGAAPEDVKVVGATKGSVIIELAVIASIATTASGIILAALKVAEKVLDIRLKSEELRGLQLRNAKLVKELEDEAENEKTQGIDEIATTVAEKLGLDPQGEGDKINALDKSVKHLVNFIEKGGVVDFVLPEEDETDGEPDDGNQELRVAFEEIRQLEQKIALLEHKEPNN